MIKVSMETNYKFNIIATKDAVRNASKALFNKTIWKDRLLPYWISWTSRKKCTILA